MKTLYLIRHAKSSWNDPGLDDFDRPLNKRGKRDAPFMASLLKGSKVQADFILSSPANRALTTARAFQDAYGLSDEDFATDKDLYHAYYRDVFRILSKVDDRYENVLCFGHNPTWTNVVNAFNDDYLANLPTCGIAEIRCPIDSWSEFSEGIGTLTNLYFPKQYFTK